jgi:hypothetical protein
MFVLVAIFALYPLSFPLACWICADMTHPDPRLDAANAAYSPLVWLMGESTPLAHAMEWYYSIWADIANRVETMRK